jgi:RNA polymerase sigma-70 factor (ECF subfamily)
MMLLSYNLGRAVGIAEDKPVRETVFGGQTRYSNTNTVDLSEEKQLVENAKNNAEAFGRLYDHYFPKVYAFIASKTYDSDDAEDITGDTFMKALENLHRFEWRGVPFGAWLFRIARNTLNDYYGRSAKNRTTDIDTAYGVSEDEEKTSPHKKAHLNELAEKVREVIKDLPERELNVIQLKFFSEMSNREITDITGLSESHVAVILYRTLRKIKPDLKNFA